MRVSVITVCFNSVATIGDCIRSVLDQTGVNVEYIIVDGGSNDGTLQAIAPFRERVAKLVSEPDQGIYDAMNKGLRLATGDIVAILNSDDLYASTSVLQDVAAAFEVEPSIGIVFGDLDYVAANDKSRVVRRWRSGPYRPDRFRRGWHPAHPAFFVRRRVYEECGLFDPSYAIAADYELMLRFLERFRIPSVYIPQTMVLMRTGGVSNRSLRAVMKANAECYRAWAANGQRAPLLLPLLKPLSKVRQLCA